MHPHDPRRLTPTPNHSVPPHGPPQPNWWRGPMARVGIIAGLILLLQIPILLIAGLVGERQDRRNEAAA